MTVSGMRRSKRISSTLNPNRTFQRCSQPLNLFLSHCTISGQRVPCENLTSVTIAEMIRGHSTREFRPGYSDALPTQALPFDLHFILIDLEMSPQNRHSNFTDTICQTKTTAGCGQFRPAVVLYTQAHQRVNRNHPQTQSLSCAFNHSTLRSGKSVQTSSTSAWLNNASCSAATEGQFFGRSSRRTTPVTTRRPAA